MRKDEAIIKELFKVSREIEELSSMCGFEDPELLDAVDRYNTLKASAGNRGIWLLYCESIGYNPSHDGADIAA